MTRKYLVMLSAACALALVTAVLGLLTTMLRSGLASAKNSDADDWVLASVALRSESEYQQAAAGFRQRYRWLVPPAPSPEGLTDAAADNADAARPALPPWRFVGVLLEEAESDRFALVAEAGRVNKYKVGDAFVDGTTLLAIEVQSLKVSQAGEERDVFLYQQN
ncbi:MAG: hypothetical protein ABJ171_17570 [Halieaceae bacterium]